MTAPARTSAGASRATLAWCAAGAYAMMAGAVFSAPFLLSSRAQQNDVFFTNLFIGPVLFTLGVIAFTASLHGLGLKRLTTFAVFAVNQSLLVVLAFLLASRSGLAGVPALAATELVDALALIVASALIAMTHGRGDAWRQSLLLGLIGAGVMTLIYALFGARFLAFGETTSSLPPYLDTRMLGISIVLGIAVFVTGWVWRRR